jgi:hypothetical protein
MKLSFLPLIVFAISVFAETSAPILPADIASFVERRDLCDHFRNEDPYDAERRDFLEANIRKLCTGTNQELAALKRKYSKNPNTILRLNKYEPKIELDTNQ